MATATEQVEVVPRDYSYVFNLYRQPIAPVPPGVGNTIHCNDPFEGRISCTGDLPGKTLARAEFLNPQTGAIYVEAPSRVTRLQFA